MTRPELTRLRNATARLERAEVAVERARRERDAAILDVLGNGVSVAEVSAVASVSVPRVYQIRESARVVAHMAGCPYATSNPSPCPYCDGISE